MRAQVRKFRTCRRHRQVFKPENLHRRHLTREQRRELVVRLRQKGWSLRRIAKLLGVSDPTVLNDLRASGAKNLAPAAVTGLDGKCYPAVAVASPPRRRR